MIEKLKNLLKFSWPSIVIASIIFYLSCLITGDDIPEMEGLIPHADKIVHFIMYFGLALVSSNYYILVKRGDINCIKFVIFAIMAPILYGGIIEILQEMYFERTGDWLDFGANTLGVLAAIPVAFWFRRYIINYHIKTNED